MGCSSTNQKNNFKPVNSAIFRDEFKFNENLPILPNYSENFYDRKTKFKCKIIKSNTTSQNIKLSVIILNDKNIDKSRNYIKEHYRFQRYGNYKNLVDKLILSRNDIDRTNYQQLNHELENYNLYAEIADSINYHIFTENEIDNIIRNNFEDINTNLETEINQFIDLCFHLITEYLKFVLVKQAKFYKCQNCDTKCLYILFSEEEKRIIEEFKPTNDDLGKGVNIVENLLGHESLINPNENEIQKLVTNVIYLNERLNKNEIELIEKNASGAVLYIKNIAQLDILLKEIYQKNYENGQYFKFILISSGEHSDNLIKFLSEEQNKIYKDILDKIIIYCSNKKQYLNKKFIDDVIDNSSLLGEYIKTFKKNSKLYKIFPVINYELYTKEYNQIHKQIAKYYGKISYSYKDAINLFKEFLFNGNKRPLKIDTNKRSKKEALLEALEVFSNDKEKGEVKIRKYTEQKNSYYQDFNYWLNSVDKTAVNKIAYFVSSLMFALNNRNTGLKSQETLYRGMNIDFSNVIKYYLNYIKDNNIISFPSFTSTSTSEKTAESFIKKNNDTFGVLFKISYKYREKLWKCLAINISSLSAFKNENECLFLPFTFYKIKNFNLNIENRLVKIELDCIFKKEILEEKLNEKNNIIYSKKNNIMELDNEISIEEEEFLIDDNEIKQNPEIRNKITIKIKVENGDKNKTFNFFNGSSIYLENDKEIDQNHKTLINMNENNTILIINGKKESFKNSFIPKESGTFSIQLLFKSKLVKCSKMFCGCEYIIDIDFSKFNTEKVEDMKGMFEDCYKLESLDLKYFNTQNVTNMSRMFSYCKKLTTINLSSFNTQNVTQMEEMFLECKSLTSLDLSSFNTEKLVNMFGMFSNCTRLKSVNLKSFNTKNVEEMGAIFRGCHSLTTIDLSSFNTQNVTNMAEMFGGGISGGCKSLKTLDLSSFNTKNVEFMNTMFFGCENLTTINLRSFNTGRVINMLEMFAECKSLLTLDLRSFNNDKVGTMISMFAKCSSLKSINLSSFKTGEVSSMDYMFEDCSSLTSLDLRSFNTRELSSMDSMFEGCSSLTSLDLRSFNTINVKTMKKAFKDCSSLISLDLHSFNTQKVEDMSSLFENCTSLKTLNISSFKTTNTSIEGMFSNCKKLSSCTSSDKNIQNEFKKK